MVGSSRKLIELETVDNGRNFGEKVNYLLWCFESSASVVSLHDDGKTTHAYRSFDDDEKQSAVHENDLYDIRPDLSKSVKL
jgi:hypothetical protein